MSEDGLVSLLRTADNVKNAIELGDTEMVIADTAKLIAQTSAAIATEGFLRTYSALDGFGRTLSLWRLDQAITGRGIGRHQALSGFVASELVGLLIDKARELNIGGWVYDLLHPTISADDLRAYMDDASWLADQPVGSSFYQDASNFRYSDNPDNEAITRYNALEGRIRRWQITVRDFDGITERVYSGIASPIVVDLGGDGIQTTNPWIHSVDFDVTGDNINDRTAWLSSEDAFLAVDQNNNGLIDGANELFGGTSRGDGFAELAAYDSDGNGAINVDDDRFSQLLLWQDRNMNGISEESEISNAGSSGLASINTSYSSQEVYQNGNLFGEVSNAVYQGHTVEIVDAYFRNVPGADANDVATFPPSIQYQTQAMLDAIANFTRSIDPSDHAMVSAPNDVQGMLLAAGCTSSDFAPRENKMISA